MSPCQISFTRFGAPAETLELTSAPEPLPAPGENQLLLEILFSPINPADLNVVEGTYGTRPDLPAVAGGEASARVVQAGPGLEDRFAPGDLVILLERLGSWRSRLLARDSEVIKIPNEMDPVQASMLAINPPTAWLLLHQFTDLAPGDIAVQNAANSGVGRSTIQIARALGLRTVNFVRRADLIPELTGLGADAVFLDDDEGLALARDFTGENPPRLALNAVGGDSALRLMDLLAPHGTHVTYGAMSRRSLKVPNSFLIFKDIRLRGLWVTKWMEAASREDVETLFGKLCGLVLESKLSQPVDGIYPAEEFAGAIARDGARDRKGKVILKFGED